MNIIMKIVNGKYLIIFFFIIIYSMRIMYLDSDVKSKNLAQIQPLDELYYNELGINVYHNGIGSLFTGELETISAANFKLFLIPSLLTTGSMKLFGNNYWGLKMGYVCMGLIAGVLLILLSYKVSNYSLAPPMVALFYVFDFNILMLSREAVTVIPCMLATIIYLCGLLYIYNDLIKMIYNGAWPIIAFCLIYGGLPFLVFFSFAYMVYGTRRNKITVLYYVAGVLIGIIACEVIDFIVFHQHVWSIVIDTLVAHSGKISGIILWRYIHSLYEYIISNTYRYNYLIIVFSSWSLLLSIYCIYKTHKEEIIIVVGLLLAHLIQIIFVPNLTLSKAAISFPVVLLMILMAVEYYIGNQIKDEYVEKYAMKALWLLAGLSVIIQMVGLLKNRSLELFDMQLVTVVTFVSLILIWTFIYKKRFEYLIATTLLSLMLMAFLSYRYIFSDLTYTDKDMLVDLNKVVKKHPIINGTGFRLYNNIYSPLDYYDHYHGVGYDEAYVERKKDSLTLYTQGTLYYFVNSEKDDVKSLNHRISKYGVCYVLEKTYYRRYIKNGKNLNLLLYKRINF